MTRGPISTFIEHHYRHFNAAALMDAAKGYVTHHLALVRVTRTKGFDNLLVYFKSLAATKSQIIISSGWLK